MITLQLLNRAQTWIEQFKISSLIPWGNYLSIAVFSALALRCKEGPVDSRELEYRPGARLYDGPHLWSSGNGHNVQSLVCFLSHLFSFGKIKQVQTLFLCLQEPWSEGMGEFQKQRCPL